MKAEFPIWNPWLWPILAATCAGEAALHSLNRTLTNAAEPTGPEPDLIRSFAAAHDAEIAWTVSGEEALMTALEKGDVDLVAGGLTSDSPWTTHASLTRDYAEAAGPDGEPVKLVMAVPPGENQMLAALEAHLDAQTREAGR